MHEGSKQHRLNLIVTMAGRIRNHCLAFQKTYYRLFKKHCHKFALMKHIAKIRKRRKEWQIVGSQCVNALIVKLDLSYQAFFKWIKTRKGPERGTPKFKKSAGNGSVTFNQAGWAYSSGNRIRFGKNWYKFIKSREIEGTIKTCTLKRDSRGKFWVTFSCVKEDVVSQIAGSTNTAGFYFGIKTFLHCSDGTTIESPEFFKTSLPEVSKGNRELASKEKGSNNRLKAKLRLSRLHQRIADRRQDWLFKLAHPLCDRYDRMYLETLNIDSMKRLRGREVSDLAPYLFLQTLKWVACKRGKHVGQLERWEPTTKTCNQCGHVQEMSFTLQVFECGGCHRSINRDLNAALNIKSLGHQRDGLGDISLDLNQAILV